jgi:hypothetical protein
MNAISKLWHGFWLRWHEGFALAREDRIRANFEGAAKHRNRADHHLLMLLFDGDPERGMDPKAHVQSDLEHEIAVEVAKSRMPF